MTLKSRDTPMQDPEAEEEERRQYGHGPLTEADLNKQYIDLM